MSTISNVVNAMLYLLTISVIGCKNNTSDNKTFKQEKYYNGKIKSEGYYVRDSVRVDTFKTYNSIGHLKVVEVYNDSGQLDGQSLYFDSAGKLIQTKTYKNGELTGPIITFYEKTGAIKSKIWFHNGNFQGDALEYYENGDPKLYNFYDFEQKNVLVREYDSAVAKYITKIGKDIIVDSLQDNADTLKFRLLIAHPPFTSNKILIEELDDSMLPLNKRYLTDSIPMTIYSLTKYRSLAKIRITVTQFDSVEDKSLSNVYLYNGK